MINQKFKTWRMRVRATAGADKASLKYRNGTNILNLEVVCKHIKVLDMNCTVCTVLSCIVRIFVHIWTHSFFFLFALASGQVPVMHTALFL